MATLPAMRPGAPQVQPSTQMRDEKHPIRYQYLLTLSLCSMSIKDVDVKDVHTYNYNLTSNLV